MPCFKSERQRKFLGAKGLLSKEHQTDWYGRKISKKRYDELVKIKENAIKKEKSSLCEKTEHDLLRRNLNRASSMGYLTKPDLREAYALGIIKKRMFDRMLKKLN